MLKLNLSASFTYSLTPTTSNLVNIESKWFIQLFSLRSNYIRGRCITVRLYDDSQKSLCIRASDWSWHISTTNQKRCFMLNNIPGISSWELSWYWLVMLQWIEDKSSKLIFFWSFRYLLQNVDIFSLIHCIIVQINKM